MTVRFSQRFGSTTFGWLAAMTVLLSAQLSSAQPACSSHCSPGPCTLSYHADGVVLDDDTGLPIAGAEITVLDTSTVSASDGSYSASGSRLDQCHFDYFFSLSVAAPGYETHIQSGYFTHLSLGGYQVRLRKEEPVVGYSISGYVAEFPACSGRMRGVTVVLEPLGLTTQTTIGGGEYSFTDVPPGNYILSVDQGCNPSGCWLDSPVDVSDSDVSTDICMGPRGEDPTPTPTPFLPGTPCPTPPWCPLGQTANCPDPGCGSTDGGCFCDDCPPCPPGQDYNGGQNSCSCGDPNSGTPTPTPDICVFPTPPLCPVGETANCVANGCIVGCSCEACPTCPDGLVYSGEPNRCDCIDPNAPRTPTPTPNICPPAQEPQCAAGEYVACGPDCACDCLPCADCPPGMQPDDAPNSCACVDPNGPTRTPTPTAFPPQTPPICPTRTPLSCDQGESTVCDTSVDPCGVCECRAVPQQPSGDGLSNGPSSSGGCAVATADSDSSVLAWSLLLMAAVAIRARRRH